MKKFIVGSFSLFLIGVTSFVMAQNTTPIVGTTSVTTPTTVPGKFEIRERIRNQARRIAQGRTSGVLSKDQAGALAEKLKSIGDQAKAFFLQNGKKPLTPDQKTQINQLLDDNSKAIYQAKHPGQTAPAASDDSNETN